LNNYAEKVMKQVVERNPGEAEFHQAVEEVISLIKYLTQRFR